MKTLTPASVILYSIGTLASIVCLFSAGYLAFHSTGQAQSLADAILFFSIATILLFLSRLSEKKMEKVAAVAIALSMLLAVIFTSHAFFGDAAIQWLTQLWR